MDRGALIFYTLAVAMAVAVALAAPLLGEAVLILTMVTPLLAVLITRLLVPGEGLTAADWATLGLFRAGFAYWPLAVVLAALAMVPGYLLYWGLGLGQATLPPSGDLPRLVVQLAASLVIGAALGALGEEVGWRGFLLPRLLHMGALRASLLVGFLHGAWHLPLMVLTPYYHSGAPLWLVVVPFLVALTLGGAAYGWLRIASASVWPAAILHRAVNLFVERLDSATTGEAGLSREMIAGESGLVAIACLAIMAWLLWQNPPDSGKRMQP